MEFFNQVLEFLNSKVVLFGYELLVWWLVVAGAILLAIIVTIIIIAAVSARKKKVAKKVAAFEAEQKLKAEQQAKAEKEEAERRAAERAAAEEEAKRIEAEQAAAKKKADAKKKAAKKAEEAKAAEAEEAPVEEVKEEKPAKKTAKKTTKKAKTQEPAPVEESPAEEVKEEPAPVEEAPAEEVKEEAPVEEAPAKPAKKATKKTTKKAPKAEPVEETPVEEAKEEVAPVEEAKEESPVEEAPKAEKGAKGKWVITKVTIEGEEAERYYFDLKANNGQILLTSWEYNSYQGALRGIETYKTNIDKDNFRIYKTKKNEFFFKLLTSKNTLLGTGSNYPTEEGCAKAIESVKRWAPNAVIDEKVLEEVQKADEVEENAETVEKVADDVVGKWEILVEKTEDGKEIYTFELRANNGHLLLASEEYTSYVGVINGINTHKANIQKGNFSIQRTKKKVKNKKPDYFYLLLNANNQPLCLGEHHKTKALCENAVESVKRFAANSPTYMDGKVITD